jgi:hypothetical protein
MGGAGGKTVQEKVGGGERGVYLYVRSQEGQTPERGRGRLTLSINLYNYTTK